MTEVRKGGNSSRLTCDYSYPIGACMYVMIPDSGKYWKVGFYRPDNEWVEAPPMEGKNSDGTYEQQQAALHVHWLNGGDNDE